MSGRLTQEQVMALPEMEYVHPKDLDDDYSPKRDTDIEGKANRTSMVDAEPLGEVRILVSRGSTDLEEDKTKVAREGAKMERDIAELRIGIAKRNKKLKELAK